MLFLLVSAVTCFSPSSSTSLRPRTPSSLFDGSEAEQLRESAQKLRDEAQAMESKLERRPSTFEPEAPAVTYTSLKDSTWTLTYRFSSDTVPGEDEEDRPVSRYSGKMTVKFLSDGYTELISHEPSGSATLEMEKVWGWDKEVSEEDDDKEYILFSTNIRVPESDVTTPNEVLRFYWQARIDEDPNISFDDGTVTVKKDPADGFWGVFNAAGILAQFQYVGNFAAKATE